MVDELRRPGTIPRDPATRTWPAAAQASAAGWIDRLQGLRERILDRLDALETLARHHPPSHPLGEEITVRDQTLEQERTELEEARRQLSAQAERQEREWGASLTQLEADRRLLGDAWERVERQRIESLGGSEGGHLPQTPVGSLPRPARTEVPQSTAPALIRSAPADLDPNHPDSQAILRQFQTLCSDVRRTAEERRDTP